MSKSTSSTWFGLLETVLQPDLGPAISPSHGISVLTPHHLAKFANENKNCFWMKSFWVHGNCSAIQEKSDGLSPSQHISTRHKTGKSLALLEHCQRFYHRCAKSASAKHFAKLPLACFLIFLANKRPMEYSFALTSATRWKESVHPYLKTQEAIVPRCHHKHPPSQHESFRLRLVLHSEFLAVFASNLNCS